MKQDQTIKKEVDDIKTPLDVCSLSFGASRDRSYEIIATKQEGEGIHGEVGVEFYGGEEDGEELVEMGEVGGGPFGKGEGGEGGRKNIAVARVDRNMGAGKEETRRIS
ncbi:hypothetical protein Tco_0728983 [Tanacetum coccineum]|uniref:Uncharacterized protein n=1 Tax=Tanacetum coccineum TaxID=301880 RepID=A0ABQ4YQB0_9ASTR